MDGGHLIYTRCLWLIITGYGYQRRDCDKYGGYDDDHGENGIASECNMLMMTVIVMMDYVDYGF